MTQPPSSDDPFGGLPPRQGDEPEGDSGDEPTRSFDGPEQQGWAVQGWSEPQAPTQQNSYGLAPQGQQPRPPQQPAGQGGYGQAPPGQPQPAQPQPGYYYGPPPGWRPQPAAHSSATTALVLGLIGIVGGMACYLPIFLAPFAWIKGSSALKAIDAEPERYGGRTEALTGKILGIIGTVLLALGLLAVAFFVVLAIVSPEFYESDTTY